MVYTQGEYFMLIDPRRYTELEDRRMGVLAGCKKLEEILQVGKIKLPDRDLQDLQVLKAKRKDKRKLLRRLEQDKIRAEKEIAEIEKQELEITKNIRNKFKAVHLPRS